MIIERNLSSFIVHCEETIGEALKKISRNAGRIVFSVNEKGMLEGVLTNGDFRRWLANNPDFDITRPVSRISNKNYKWAYLDDEPDRISAAMGDHTCIPLLDRNGHLGAIAQRSGAEVIKIDGRVIADDAPTFVIAEIGLNHNGSLDLAKELIDLAAAAGADSAKFQMRDLKTLYRNAPKVAPSAEDLGTQYTLGLLERFELKPDQMFEAFDHCKSHSIAPICTPWDFESLKRLQEYGMEAYKVASADLTNHDLLEAMADTQKVLICSTGMSMELEIIQTVDLLRKRRAPYVLMHCNSTYPAPFKDVNLRYLHRLKEIGRCVVGYSGHERGQSVALAAVACGARVIEKHFTIDKTMEGNDHKVSLLPAEMTEMIKSIRQIEAALGSAAERKMTQGEMMNRNNLAKSLIINQDLPAGETITAEMVIVRSPGRGIQPNRKADLIGRKAKRAFTEGDFFFESDLEEEHVQARDYDFKRPWGVAVRYHDFRKIMAKSNLDFLEFHLSFKDVDENIHDHLKEKLDFDLVVHSPDLFKGDHLLNLCSEDSEYRKRSLCELQRVIDLTRSMRDFFTKISPRTILIASIGGFSKESPLKPDEIARSYAIAGESLSQLKTDGVEILPQTLPPFPWYFGGQLFANCFVQPDDTAEFSRTYGYRLCFDLCHSKLSCNHLGTSFLDYVEKIGPHSGHLHVADAGGVDGEGLQIGEGDMDFGAIAQVLDRTCPKASFIPEIWQGHKNEGEGFWLAASRLEGLF